MLPSILARQYQEGLIDYIDTSFPITNSIFKDSLRNMLNTKDSVFHEPYVAVRLPFRVSNLFSKSFFDTVPSGLEMLNSGNGSPSSKAKPPSGGNSSWMQAVRDNRLIM